MERGNQAGEEHKKTGGKQEKKVSKQEGLTCGYCSVHLYHVDVPGFETKYPP